MDAFNYRGNTALHFAKEYGFCWGVERSIELAWAARDAYPDKKMHITNELIHNPGVNELLAILLLCKKFGVAVCPHAGGVGLCEYVRHITIFNYIRVSATLKDSICESTTHLHEHFEDPWLMERGHYMPPTMAGYGTMKRASIDEFEFPHGPVHQKRAAAAQSKL